MQRDLKIIKLPCGNEAEYFCVSIDCHLPSPTCGIKSCTCNQPHKNQKCKLKTDVQNMIEQILKKTLIDNWYDSSTKQMRIWKDSIKEYIHMALMQEDQKKFYNLLKNKNTKEMISSFMVKVQQCFQNTKKEDFNKIIKALQKQTQNHNNTVKQSFDNIKNILLHSINKTTFQSSTQVPKSITSSSQNNISSASSLQPQMKLNQFLNKFIQSYTSKSIPKSHSYSKTRPVSPKLFQASSSYQKKTQFYFDKDIGQSIREYFKISQNACQIEVIKNNVFRFAIVGPDLKPNSPFRINFAFKELTSKPRCMYIGICNFSKAISNSLQCNLDQDSEVFLMSNSGQIYSCFSRTSISCEGIQYKKGDIVEMSYQNKKGLLFQNRIKQTSTHIFPSINITQDTRICIVLAHLNTKVQIVNNQFIN